MPYHGPFAMVEDDPQFRGEFDEWENDAYVEATDPQSDQRLVCNIAVEHGESLDDGHLLIGVVDHMPPAAEDFERFDDLDIGDRIVITTDGFDRATRTLNPVTKEGTADAIGREARVYTSNAWAEYMMGVSEANAEARLDRQRERHLDQHGHF